MIWRLILVVFTIVVLTASVAAQSECTVRKDSNGIKVFSCSVEDSKLNSIKAVFELEAGMDELVAVLRDVAAYNIWQYRMTNQKLIRKTTNTITYYGEIAAPWPVSNRDMIILLNFNYDSIRKELQVDATGLPAELPVVEDVIRVPMFKAKWTVKEASNHRLNVEYKLLIDIGGSIPVWIMNVAQAEGPYETFNKLKTHIRSIKYQGEKNSLSGN